MNQTKIKYLGILQDIINEITPAVGATKSHILDLIKDHCVENDIIDEVEEKPIMETVEILRLKLDFEREELRLAHEEAQRARKAAEAEAQKP